VTAKTTTLRERQRLMTKSEIVRLAFELFAKRGYEDVTVEMIAESAGISRATFFNYFPKKDLILHELAATRAERIRQAFATLRDQTQTFTRADLLRIILEKALDVLTEALSNFICDKSSTRLVAETLFCVFLGTMLEWLMREDVPEQWLVETMQVRVQFLLGAVQ